MNRLLICTYLAVICLLSACATSPENRFSLAEALDGKTAISIPMRVTEKGLIVLEGVKVDGHSLDMVLDTGATRSAIFETAFMRLDLDLTSDDEAMVHGMVQSKEHSIVDLPRVEIGPLQYPIKPMVILNNRDPDFQKMEIYDGLIGMDVLANYQIYMSPTTNELRFIPNENPVYISYFWPRIPLIGNPFQSDDRTLHFMEIRIDGRKTPAMLDTGAEFSAMNWASASYAQAKPIRRRLRKQWELQGAVGTFNPTAKVIMERIRGGQIFWDDTEFVIMDFDSLDILGIENEPFILAGMNLFKGETIFIDFERGFLSLVPEDTGQENMTSQSN